MAFNRNLLGELRPNQIITTFGPGAIVDAVKDSVTVLDISYWKEKGKKIIDGRLASYLGVDCFYMPRTSANWGDVPVVAFPYMHVCSKCGRLFDLRENFDLENYLSHGASCPECHWSAIPPGLSPYAKTDIWMISRGAGGFTEAMKAATGISGFIPPATPQRLPI